ncbi:hypothetical protein SDRG_03787 [Saprolegnia diclina VS20]|uniref:Uncharacterized protein n=1 Tax=Saprolegnia diclina (strain VS20) TaxID=1156394 RepID=T0QL78_SAPDV|nr:hypothetical protein SDRG_03787 [Saprolegnia diclina VS20]EQC38829.1 hypothetical protein SDRG_03787 [Saprolegnia diclina VS20]|eukprot:XP_008607653.1 hypothetical protein SDRG_03787 [Saprolegnia diclina VS20]
MGLGVAPAFMYDDLLLVWLTTCSFLIIAFLCACVAIAVLGCTVGGLQCAYKPLRQCLNWEAFVGLLALYFFVVETYELAADIYPPDTTKQTRATLSYRYFVTVPGHFVKSVYVFCTQASTDRLA